MASLLLRCGAPLNARLRRPGPCKYMFIRFCSNQSVLLSIVIGMASVRSGQWLALGRIAGAVGGVHSAVSRPSRPPGSWRPEVRNADEAFEERRSVPRHR